MRNRMRSVLTMLGIVWGLASVVILLAYGQGLGGGVLGAFLNMGNNVIVFWPGQTSMQAGGQRAGKKVPTNTKMWKPFATRSRWSAPSARNRPAIWIQGRHSGRIHSDTRGGIPLRADA